MLLTRWGEIDLNETDKTLHISDSETSVWIKIVAAWICFFLYGWVMLAPAACADRQFGTAGGGGVYGPSYRVSV